MKHRYYSEKLVLIQENIRTELLNKLRIFDISKIESALVIKDSILQQINNITIDTENTKDEKFFANYKFILVSLFHLLEWGSKELKGIDNSNVSLNSSKVNIQQVDLEIFNYIPDFKNNIEELKQLILNTNIVNGIRTIINKFVTISFPTFYTFETKSHYAMRNVDMEEKEDEDVPVYMLSIQFTINNEPWANPQILQPERLYTIKGILSLNQWPVGFDTLILKPATTVENDWFSLSLPDIKRNNENEYKIDGHILFKYPQHSFEDSISIRLFGYFTNAIGDTEHPTLIGYNQLITKVLDPNSFHFPTGFNSMNRTLSDIAISIEKEIPDIDKKEKDDFLNLLSGVLNYQGFCAQQGIYKQKDSITENEFRDNLIQHLIANPHIGEEISKESHIAGGRVEISYRGIIAELKVENTISDRDKLFEKYGKQPIAYSSGNAKQLSIICILDLTEKRNPPAPLQNNIRMLTPELHGFENKEPEYVAKLVMVIIDGNTQNPSDYSRKKAL